MRRIILAALLLMVAGIQSAFAQYSMKVWRNGEITLFMVNEVDSVTYSKLITDISLSEKTAELEVGSTLQLHATISPADADEQNLIWESSNPSVATVDETGLLTAKLKGTCTIECRTTDGSNLSDMCQVTVTKTEIVHEYVNLGLPSGTLWATCNVGALSPEDCGAYFAWGETEPKEEYSWATYRWTSNGNSFNIFKYTRDDGLLQGCWNMSIGDGDWKFIGDGKTELMPEDDAAAANWGNDWQMPSRAQWVELYNSKYTTKEWTTQNGVMGLLVTSKINDNNIFLPAAGFCDGESLEDLGVYCCYWTRFLGDNSTVGEGWYFPDDIEYYHRKRCLGQCVRPVRVQEEDPHEYVDLDLPSGTLWAKCNVGANDPEEYGDYFAWGETVPKEDYSWGTYLWMNEGQAEWSQINKYTFADNQTDACWYSGGTFIGDGSKELLPEDDAATVNWGSKWKTPSAEQMEELLDSKNTTSTWTTRYGVNGRLVTSKRNQKSIFLPAGGRLNGKNPQEKGAYGIYWSNSISEFTDHARDFYVNENNLSMGRYDRCCGENIRPVRNY